MGKIIASSQDCFNSIARGITSDALIQYILYPDGPLDYDLLRRAVLLSVKAVPVLGCVLDTKRKVPEWKRYSRADSADCDSVFCSVVSTGDIDSATGDFLSTELDASQRPPLKVCLIVNPKTPEEIDSSCVLLIKLSHAVCDGSGSKFYLKLLSEIYSRLQADPNYEHELLDVARDTSAFYAAMGISNIHKYFDPAKAELVSTWGFPTGNASSSAMKSSRIMMHFGKDEMQKIKELDAECGAGINSVLTAAFYDSLLKVLNPDYNSEGKAVREIQFMIDLRKYLTAGYTRGIYNLSAISNVDLPAGESDFKKLVSLTDAAINDVVSSGNFIHGTLACDMAMDSGFPVISDFFKKDWNDILESGKCTPMISNLGVISKDKLYFGKIPIENIYLVPPAFRFPAFMLGISTYNDVLTLSAGYYGAEREREIIKNLMEEMRRKVLDLC
ncbi:MAG: hypothetical protein LKI53_07485 [Bacteroidales bacterium]|jgi:NRPS condensation-like uncharacterized protein|nr:hypothetical protein [Bacteroidales bacterium]